MAKRSRRRLIGRLGGWILLLAGAGLLVLVLVAGVGLALMLGWIGDAKISFGGGGEMERTEPQGAEEVSEGEQQGDLMVGRWRGEWTGEKMGQGALRCEIVPAAGGDYRAVFFATFMGGMTHESEVTLSVKRKADDQWYFEGDADLGFPWGVYHYVGHTDGERFFSRFDSSYDRGVFEMHRVNPQGG